MAVIRPENMNGRTDHIHEGLIGRPPPPPPGAATSAKTTEFLCVDDHRESLPMKKRPHALMLQGSDHQQGQGRGALRASNQAAKTVVQKAYPCLTCGETFPSGQALGGHQTRHRRSHQTGTLVIKKKASAESELARDIEGDESGGGKNSTTTTREYKCSTCDKVFGTFQALGGHRSSHSYKNKHEAKTGMDGGRDGEEEGCGGSKEVGKRFKCNICSKMFPSGQALGGHKTTHFRATTSHDEPSSSSPQATTAATATATATPTPTPTQEHSASEKATNSLGGIVLDFDLNDLAPMEE